jgi:outer membrane receptor protein involved in Fe transport
MFPLLLTALQAASADTIVVTAERRETALRDVPAAISVLSREEAELVSPRAPAELLNRAAGVFVQPGSGRESLVSIRSPVLTGGAGAGSFLYLSDGVPLRAPGFANVNGLFDLPLPFAERIEVVRGPGEVVYGSNALHGAVNALTPAPGAEDGRVRLSAGSFDRYAGLLEGGNGRARGGLSWLSDGGYRAESGALQLKAYGSAALGQATLRLSAHHLEQETAGFVRGQDAFRDDALRRSNPDPEAFRDSRHVLLSAEVPVAAGGWDGTLSPYARYAEMDFRLHFLPGDALEENAHGSVGLQSQAERALTERLTLLTGLDLDATRGTLREFQEQETVFSFVQGLHYDYRVDALEAAPFARLTYEPTERLTLRGGLRATLTRYDYENEAGGGAVTGRFLRPGDRTDEFAAITAKASAAYQTERGLLYASLARGARPPQTTDLYRLQLNQDPDGIEPETLDAAEFGWRVSSPRGSLSVAGFAMRKENLFFRDADGFNVTDGETTHLGMEAEGTLRLSDRLTLTAAGTVAEHAYAFTRLGQPQEDGTRQELIRDGNEVDTAPTTLGSARLLWTPTRALAFEAALTHVGAYFTDAENENEYGGHDLLDLRASWSPRPDVTLLAILRNATDERYADRADFAFGSERYFPGEERAAEVVLQVGF